MRMFKIVTATTSTGPRLFVAIDTSFSFPMLGAQDENIILTADAADQGEFDGMVDELIEELKELKDSARLQFSILDQRATKG